MNVLNESWTLVHIYDKRRWTMERRRIRSVAGTTRVAFTMSSTCKLRVAVCERVLFDDMMQPSRQYKSLIHNEYEWILVNHYLIVSRISHTHTHTHRRQCPTIQCCHLCSGICPFPHYLGNSVIMMRESQWMKATLTRSQSSKWNMVCLYVWASEAILSFVFFSIIVAHFERPNIADQNYWIDALRPWLDDLDYRFISHVIPCQFFSYTIQLDDVQKKKLTSHITLTQCNLKQLGILLWIKVNDQIWAQYISIMSIPM